jgi:hypothetical protein
MVVIMMDAEFVDRTPQSNGSTPSIKQVPDLDRLFVLRLFLVFSVPAGQFCATDLNSATFSNLLFPGLIMEGRKLLRES